MPANPETRESLILRLPSAADAQAWREFVDLYEPLLLRFAKRRGLQDADAREVAQNVFISVAKAVEKWRPDQERGRFRAWLFRIARNHVINWVTKRASVQRLGTSFPAGFQDPADISASAQHSAEMEYRREMFRLAAAQVRESFSENSWNAFWRTSVLDEPIDLVAGEIGISTGAIYVARSRVLARIRSIIEEWENENAL
jgi:RNA polymerase sigma-70 factor, ECF subfamily